VRVLKVVVPGAGAPAAALTSFNAAIVEATAALTLAPSGAPVLQGGQKYWLVGRSTSDYVDWVHGFNKFGETASASGTSWDVSQGPTLPAFAVLGLAVREPTTLMLMGIRLVAAVLRRRGNCLTGR
jgi:hypothetical protein